MLMVKTDRKVQDLLDKIVKQSRKKGLTTNSKITEHIVASKKNSSRCHSQTSTTM